MLARLDIPCQYQNNMDPSINVLGTTLKTCSADPLTGWFRDGCCNTDSRDRGTHTVCVVVDEAFLTFSASAGNDLTTPRPDMRFPGLKPGIDGVSAQKGGNRHSMRAARLLWIWKLRTARPSISSNYRFWKCMLLIRESLWTYL